MKEAFIKLHLSIIIAGATGIFGKLITLNEGLLVWYRMLLASMLLLLWLAARREVPKIPLKAMLQIGGVGLLLGIHWVLFYGSIKASNVSIGVVCFSSIGFFTALFEPLIYRRRVSFRELFFSLLTLAGILLIFHFDSRYRLGIAMGICSAALAALFTIANKRVGQHYPGRTMLLYEMGGGFLGISCLLPFYFHFFSVEVVFPGMWDLLYLFLLASVCTIGLYLLQIAALRSISAFTLNLSYNLEPIYSIILAMILFNENKELNTAFYAGLGIIVLSVVLQTWSVLKKRS